MTDLVSFLRDRWDEEERDARAAATGPWTAIENYPAAYVVADADGAYIVNESDQGDVVEGDAVHIARWDPARVLAEVTAKRAILAAVEGLDGQWFDEIEATVQEALARPYASHPDFDTSWAATAPS